MEGVCACGYTTHLCEDCYVKRAFRSIESFGDPFLLKDGGGMFFRFKKDQIDECLKCHQHVHKLIGVPRQQQLESHESWLGFSIPHFRETGCVYCVIESAGLLLGCVCQACVLLGTCNMCKTEFGEDDLEREEELQRKREELIAFLKKEESKL